MPWWWRVVGTSSELVTWRRSESDVLTESGGGLWKKVTSTHRGGWRGLRPAIVDADDTTGEEAVGICILDIGDVPPEFLDAGQGGGGQGEEGEAGGEHGSARHGSYLRVLRGRSG